MIFIFKGDFFELHHRVRGLETWTWGIRLGFYWVFFSAVARFHRRGERVVFTGAVILYFLLKNWTRRECLDACRTISMMKKVGVVCVIY